MALKKLLKVLCWCFLSCGSYGAISSEDGRSESARGFDARSMLTSLATDLMSRGYVGNGGGSQVVSLNLTNLMVLVLLKVLIFAAGSLGAGTWKGGYGRSSDGEESIVTEDEILLYLSYLAGTPGDNGCLQFVACKGPQQARRYAAAGEMVLRATKIFGQGQDASYEHVLDEVREASRIGLAGGSCERFACGKNKRR